ncbi:histidine kinase-, DNA gyrase B-, and HSP90-like ATPase family protein isoform X2 [Tasmannia lanceolata]|uniref:histidine kinase-, DNA gyrase B-, and HSP90-like ATPase family protein isoform X2 n=1 Tax=Tasmannia lanceolata TaxID=3420 RepID=UPI0040641F52
MRTHEIMLEMSFPEIVDLCSDEDTEQPDFKPFKQDRGSVLSTVQLREDTTAENFREQKFDPRIKGSKDSRSSNTIRAQTSSRFSDQDSSVVDGSSPSPCSSPPGWREPPLCQQFWKAGNYDVGHASKTVSQNGKSHLRVHPKFLHSNATSHKWALGAIAELLDNAVDEIQNGATFVNVDKISNPRNGSPALLIQDDGGGMDPECMRRCLSFGFSDKKAKSAIGQYGNGFKTSTMRLGADAIVFSRCMGKRTLTQSVGLLSYTFLRLTGHTDIVVPMVNYEFNPSSGAFGTILRTSKEHFSSNLSTLLKWSPYATEAELLKQFDDIGHHGTKVIVYNLWLNDDGGMELDFESDKEDILISGAPKIVETNSIPRMLTQNHFANRYHYSLRVYSSFLYLRIPETFKIILRGQPVVHRNFANDIKFPEYILYRPQVGGSMEAQVITTIGFLKEAPHVNIHGFNVYHKNRLILPFWQVVHQSNSRGRGVAGVLEANFIEPTHDKQDFEKTSLLQKLETRLRQMTFEYWDYHCGLIGYHQSRKIPSSSVPSNSTLQPVVVNTKTPGSVGGVFPDPSGTPSSFSAGRPVVTALSAPNALNSPTRVDAARRSTPGQLFDDFENSFQPGFPGKRKQQSCKEAPNSMKKQAVSGAIATDIGHIDETECRENVENSPRNPEAIRLMEENKKLRTQCEEYEKNEKELELKVQQLRIKLEEVNCEYERLLKESESIGAVKVEKL